MKWLWSMVVTWWTTISQITPTPAPIKNIIHEERKTPGISIKWEGNEYEYAWWSSTPQNQVVYIANYDKQFPSQKISNDNLCRAGINGGFYDTDFKPLGWVRSSDKEISQNRKNSLFNGYIFTTEKGVEISRILPIKTDNGVQTGPILIWDAIPINLQLIQDKQARRMTAVSGPSKSWWVAVWSKDDTESGPALAEMPKLMELIIKTEEWPANKAINLDGGRASAFDNGKMKITESTAVGGWWCLI